MRLHFAPPPIPDPSKLSIERNLLWVGSCRPSLDLRMTAFSIFKIYNDLRQASMVLCGRQLGFLPYSLALAAQKLNLAQLGYDVLP